MQIKLAPCLETLAKLFMEHLTADKLFFKPRLEPLPGKSNTDCLEVKRLGVRSSVKFRVQRLGCCPQDQAKAWTLNSVFRNRSLCDGVVICAIIIQPAFGVSKDSAPGYGVALRITQPIHSFAGSTSALSRVCDE